MFVIKKPKQIFDAIKRMKLCKQCEKWKNLYEFYEDGRYISNRASICKECAKANRKKRYLESINKK
jgi:superfamily II helicase